MFDTLFLQLKAASAKNILPAVIAYNRIDGPGSSLDLREFQQAMWSLVHPPKDPFQDISMPWSKELPRTVGMTIDIGTHIQAEPYEPGKICVRSVDYGTEVSSEVGKVPPTRENWLLKILDIFRLDGVRFVLHNLRPGVQSSGLGGSATATTGTCILANHLMGCPMSSSQLITLASCLEQDLGVSITGTQEQANVLYGGIRDYIWFPWGIPGRPETSYGASIHTELMKPEKYHSLRSRIAIYHTGQPRKSSNVNTVWREALLNTEGYLLHHKKLNIAYRFREALRSEDWAEMMNTITEYREIRTELCPAYMEGTTKIHGSSQDRNCTAFPLGAGGGGAVLLFGLNPDNMESLKKDLSPTYTEIPFEFRNKGHELVNLPLL